MSISVEPHAARRVRVLVGDAARALAAEPGSLPRVLIEHSLDPKERVRWERVDGCSLVVLRTPFVDGTPEVAFTTIPIGIVFTRHELVVVSAVENDVTRCLATRLGADAAPDLGEVIGLALDATARAFGSAIEVIETSIDRIEDRLARSLRNTEVLELLRYQKALVHHTAALRATTTLLERLPEATGLASDSDELREARIELRQVLEVADLERETLGETMDAFASIISNNLNDVMRVLTAFAVVLTPPVTIASLWGMNVILPFAQHPQAFWILSAISTGASLLVAILLRQRRWL